MANFVSTLDGIVSYALPGRAHAGAISEGNEADRFVLALLRACADTIVVGAGTLREEREHIWTPEFVYAAAADEFAALRRALRKPPRATVVFVSASGDVDRDAPIFHADVPVRVLTGKRSPRALIAEAGGGLVVTEGGPTLFAELLREHVVDELFLTYAPRLAGRSASAPRRALVEGHGFSPDEAPRGRLASLKRSGDFLFARYRLENERR